jgi:glycosyltransferase involved in cell wall biosynthesis
VFWGVIDRRLDVPSIAKLAAEMTEGTIVLVGPEQNPDPALVGMTRVARIGPVPYEQLPALAREARVLVMPYANLTVNQMLQPLKMKEYLATQLPVVLTDLPATRAWADALDVVTDPSMFSSVVRRRLETGLPREQSLARARLTNEGWTAKAAQFERWIIPESDLDASTYMNCNSYTLS